MTIVEALKTVNAAAARDIPKRKMALLTGFTPLHLETLLKGELQMRSPDHQIVLETGLYGDLEGNLDRIAVSDVEGAAVVVEWPDIDPRLGIRNLGGWTSTALEDILRSAEARCGRLADRLLRANRRVAVCLPTLPIPFASSAPTREIGPWEARLRHLVTGFAVELAGSRHIGLLNTGRLDVESPSGARADADSEVRTGFPYSRTHAAYLASALAGSLLPASARKGIITDLDNTLWCGILGEVGIDGVHWDLDRHSHMHAFYQQFLASLASAGVFVAVASKNDPELVVQALQRADLHVGPDMLYPVEAHWNAKSQSVARILARWNIAPDAVVFVDDSPMELAEVKAAFPDIECLQFPENDVAGVLALCRRLRDLLGRTHVSEEDALRVDSVRRSEALQDALAAAGEGGPDVLADAEAVLTVEITEQGTDARAFELVNKTNQFNLNGRRYTEATWHSTFSDGSHVLVVASYRDKFGSLGKISALVGRRDGDRLRVESWVLSCRAFSRRIEHAIVAELFRQFDLREISFDFVSTPRNGPTRAFFEALAGPVDGEPVIDRKTFEAACPPLYHRIESKMTAGESAASNAGVQVT